MTKLAGDLDDGAHASAEARELRSSLSADEAARSRRQVLLSESVHWELNLLSGRWW